MWLLLLFANICPDGNRRLDSRPSRNSPMSVLRGGFRDRRIFRLPDNERFPEENERILVLKTTNPDRSNVGVCCFNNIFYYSSIAAFLEVGGTVLALGVSMPLIRAVILLMGEMLG